MDDLLDPTVDPSILADATTASDSLDANNLAFFSDVPVDETMASSITGLDTSQCLITDTYTPAGVPVNIAPFDATQAALVNGQIYPTSTDDAIGSLTTQDASTAYDATQLNPAALTRVAQTAMMSTGATGSVAANAQQGGSVGAAGLIASSADALGRLVNTGATAVNAALSVTRAVQGNQPIPGQVRPVAGLGAGVASVGMASNGVSTISPMTIAFGLAAVVFLMIAAKHGSA